MITVNESLAGIADQTDRMVIARYTHAVREQLAAAGHTGPLSIGEQKFIAGCQSRGLSAAECAAKVISWNGPLTSIFTDEVRI